MTPPTSTPVDPNTPLEENPMTKKGPTKMPAFRMPDYKSMDPHEARKLLKEKLACAFRIFAKYGFDEGVAGHITVRDPVEPTTFWVNPFGLHFSLIKASDLIRVDHVGSVIEGGPIRALNTAAYRIHHAVHTARPDVLCAAHSHSIYGRAFASLGRKLDMITQDSCAFYDSHALYSNFNGVVLGEEEGLAIAEALGPKNKACILQNHGLLTTGDTVEGCVFWFLSMDKCCHAQLLADAAAAGRGGETVKISDEDAAETYRVVGTNAAGWFSGVPLFQVIDAETGGDYKN
ncbi:ribulose-5-phosphate 4-epimerase [Ascodesmis nigricans]|uniref:Ribulose-5-phosphate 4-epimerase n=1 Tax=Ascodesmis nigricans TaxID=341454 RepID=A0A4S2MYJ0_9PEZI|nr:ribulose-5-phosphate 4-epimerase [Ascodesmis nigricans]